MGARTSSRRRVMLVGILGGTFNPPHIGHLVLAEQARTALSLEKVILVPTHIPPHKSLGRPYARHRYNMTACACRNNPFFFASRIEIDRGSTSYTIDTVRAFRTRLGRQCALFFIAGADVYNMIRQWKNAEALADSVEFIVAERPGHPVTASFGRVHTISIPQIDITSSGIRARIKKNKSVRYLVPDAVYRYITAHGLY